MSPATCRRIPRTTNTGSGRTASTSGASRRRKFVSKSFREVSPGHYEAVADLTIHGVTKEVKLPFALAINGNSAHMTGELTLSRVDFGVGTGNTWGIDWSSERTVSHAVKVTVDLLATRTP